MKNKIYFLIPIAQICLVLLASFFYIIETNDSRSYYFIAFNFPYISNSLFPILYPLILKLFYFFVNDFFIASKTINIVCILIFFCMTKIYIKEWKLIWLFSMSCFFSRFLHTHGQKFYQFLYLQFFLFYKFLFILTTLISTTNDHRKRTYSQFIQRKRQRKCSFLCKWRF